jgi:hypothetical protein
MAAKCKPRMPQTVSLKDQYRESNPIHQSTTITSCIMGNLHKQHQLHGGNLFADGDAPPFNDYRLARIFKKLFFN